MLQCDKCGKESNKVTDFWVNYQCQIECLKCKMKEKRRIEKEVNNDDNPE